MRLSSMLCFETVHPTAALKRSQSSGVGEDIRPQNYRVPSSGVCPVGLEGDMASETFGWPHVGTVIHTLQ